MFASDNSISLGIILLLPRIFDRLNLRDARMSSIFNGIALKLQLWPAPLLGVDY